MVRDNRTVKHFETRRLGSYNHEDGARYVHPLFFNAGQSDLVDLHEFLHKYLSTSNFPDGIGRVLVKILSRHSEKLPAEVRDGFFDILNAIHRNSVFTHEVIATFVSIRFFSPKYDYVVQELPDAYREFYQFGEQYFSDFDREQEGEILFPIMLAFAMAAMNTPIDLSMFGRNSIAKCINFFDENSADIRFQKLCKEADFLALRRQFDLMLKEYSVEYPSSRPQEIVHEEIRKNSPLIEFTRNPERPNFLDEFLETIHRWLFVDFDIDVKATLLIVEHDLDVKIKHLGGQVEIPDVNSNSPQDRSLAINQFPEMSFELFKDSLNEFEDGLNIFAFVDKIQPSKDSDLGGSSFRVRAYKGRQGSRWFAETELNLKEWCDFFEGDQSRKVVLKFDISDLTSIEVAVMLSNLGHPVFFISRGELGVLHETVAVLFASGLKVASIGRVRLADDGFSVIMIHFDEIGVTFLASATDIGSNLIRSLESDFEGAKVIEDYDEYWPHSLKINMETLFELIGGIHFG